MSITHDNFTHWYKNILEDLYGDGNAGFVILIIAIPLIERYLREKSGVAEKDLDDTFFTEFRKIFPELTDNPTAKKFWHVYRNGLLHQVSLSRQNKKGVGMPTSWLSGCVPAVEVKSGEFWVNPNEFSKRVISTIESDFGTFEGKLSSNHNFPVIHVSSSGTSSVHPYSPPPTGII